MYIWQITVCNFVELNSDYSGEIWLKILRYFHGNLLIFDTAFKALKFSKIFMEILGYVWCFEELIAGFGEICLECLWNFINFGEMCLLMLGMWFNFFKEIEGISGGFEIFKNLSLWFQWNSCCLGYIYLHFLCILYFAFFKNLLRHFIHPFKWEFTLEFWRNGLKMF